LWALTQLQSYRLDEALQGFRFAAEEREILHRKAAVETLAGLVLTYQAMQRTDDALDAVKQLLEFAQETAEPEHIAVAESCRARLALLRGDLQSANRWAQSFDAEPHAPGALFWLEVPLITQARVRIATGNREGLEKALESLGLLRQQGAALHFTCLTIEIGVLQSVALEKLGRTDEALEALKEALALARPGGWIRPFVEAGLPMVDLLKRLRRQNVALDYIERLLAAFPDDEPKSRPEASGHDRQSPHHPLSPSPSHPTPQPLVESLTNRELVILELLAQRLQNKEIAEKLFVSPETIKTHLNNIYQKLNASNRREAVARAERLGILKG
jgi:LuxR family maltose regulon positive regulatory protein